MSGNLSKTDSTNLAPTPFGSMGVGGAAVIIFSWILSFWHIAMPDQVSIAFTVIFGAAFHAFTLWKKSVTKSSTVPTSPAAGV